MTEPKAPYAAGEQPAAAKPCPFCGSSDLGGTKSIVWCNYCGGEGPDKATVFDNAVDNWNTRYLDKTMPCGHAARYAVQADEGTAFCALCELDGAREQARRSSLCRAATMTPDEHAAYREQVQRLIYCDKDGER